MGRSTCLPLGVALVACATPALADPPPMPSSRPLFRSAQDPPVPAPPQRAHRALRLLLHHGPGAEPCLDEAAVRDAVARNIGYDPFSAAATESLTLTVAREDRAFAVTLELGDAAGRVTWASPTLRGASCADLLRGGALALAVEIDPFAAPQGPVPAPGPPVVLQLPPQPTLTGPPAPAVVDRAVPVSPSPMRPKVRVGLAAAAEKGSEPALTAGLTAQVGVRWPYVSVALEGRFDVPGSASMPQPGVSDLQIRTLLAGGSVVPCGHLPLPAPLDRWNLAGCGLLTLGVFEGQGEGTADMPKHFGTMASAGAGFFALAGGRLALEIAVGGPVSLRLAGDLLGTLRPGTIQILTGPPPPAPGTLHSVWTMPALTGAAGFGVVADF